jgi:hypothetical protein
MITRENLRDVIGSLPEKTKKRILSSEKYYVVLELHIFNTGAYATARLTNDYGRYQHAWKRGNCILCIEDVQSILRDLSTNVTTL